MIKKKILVVGGGFRGILTANQLKENNSIDLIEKSSYIGGVLFSEKWNGFYLDKGVHIFDNTSNEDTKLIPSVALFVKIIFSEDGELINLLTVNLASS